MQASGGARAVRVGWKGEEAERLAEGRAAWLPRKAPLLQGCTSPETSKVHPLPRHLLAFSSWLDGSCHTPTPRCPGPFHRALSPAPPPHAPQLSLGSAPPQPSSFLLSCWSPSFGIHSSLSSTTPDTASPSCPYLPPPVLFFWKKRSRGTLPLVPLKTLPCDLPFRCPRAPPQSLDFPN